MQLHLFSFELNVAFVLDKKQITVLREHQPTVIRSANSSEALLRSRLF